MTRRRDWRDAHSRASPACLTTVGGSALGFRSWSCATLPEKQGLNRLWRNCKVRFAKVGGTEQTLQLFASIIERQGRFKILSYANAF